MCCQNCQNNVNRPQARPPIDAQDQMPTTPAARAPERSRFPDEDPSNVRAPASKGGNKPTQQPLGFPQNDVMTGKRAAAAPGKNGAPASQEPGTAKAAAAGGGQGGGLGNILQGIVGAIGQLLGGGAGGGILGQLLQGIVGGGQGQNGGQAGGGNNFLQQIMGLLGGI